MVKTVVYKNQSPLKKVSVKVKDDIVFSSDLSHSMRVVAEGLQKSINNFVKKLENDLKFLDWRIGFIGSKFVAKKRIVYYKLDFTKDTGKFISALKTPKFGGDEIALPTIDRAADFNWRSDSHKFIIYLTDETVEKGWAPPVSYKNVERLKSKIIDLGISLIIIAPKCEAFEILASADKCNFFEINNKKDLEKGKFESFLGKMSVEVSTKSMGIVVKEKTVEKDIYDIEKKKGFSLYFFEKGQWKEK
jgi:hypothetical protein